MDLELRRDSQGRTIRELGGEDTWEKIFLHGECFNRQFPKGTEEEWTRPDPQISTAVLFYDELDTEFMGTVREHIYPCRLDGGKMDGASIAISYWSYERLIPLVWTAAGRWEIPCNMEEEIDMYAIGRSIRGE